MLYNEGLFLLNNKGDYKAAAKKFDEVDRQDPYSDWARKSLLMSAYAYYQAEEYDDCVNSAKRYITLHPASPDAAYAQYLIGESYYDQNSRRFARSGSGDACDRRAARSGAQISAKRIRHCRTEKDRHGARPARRQGNGHRPLLREKRDFVGAINRFKVVVTQYQTTRHVEEALERLSECYVALGIMDEAQTAAAVLGHNFPDSPWYKDAYNLVKNAGGVADHRE